MAILVEGCSKIKDLKEMIQVLDGDVMDSARQIPDLNVVSSRNSMIMKTFHYIVSITISH